MKKTLFILSLFLAAHVAISGNNAGSSLNTSKQDASKAVVNDAIEAFSVNLSDDYVLSGNRIRTGVDTYIYMGVLSHGTEVIGTVTGTCQMLLIDGVLTMVLDDDSETYSNDETSTVVKAKHNAVKNAIQNVR